MAERKAVNKYYPPDWDPSKGSVNKHVGQHPLRERARKLSQGILIIRFEMPYNIWCGGCGNHIGMGVRYNAEKKKVGNYYTTPIYRFRMKCHLCDNYIEIETDPKNCDYTIVAGARRKEERWDPAAAENVIATDHAEKQKLIDDAMFKLEHGEKDKRKSKAAIPGLLQIKDMQTQWKDDFALNQMLRKKFRQEKKVILEKEEKDQEIIDKGGLDLELVNEDPNDIAIAKNIKFRADGYEEDKRKRRLQIKSRPMFSETTDKNSQRVSLLEKRQKMMITTPHLTTVFTKNSEDFGVRRRKSGDIKEKECSASVAQEENKSERTSGENLINNFVPKMYSKSTPEETKCGMNECVKLHSELYDDTVKSPREHDTLNNVVVQKVRQNDKQQECALQVNEKKETFIGTDKSQTKSMCTSQKASEEKIDNVSQNKISNVNTMEIFCENNDFQTTRRTSLVSEMYSDSDSDSSKQ